jgi:hypothetical protein
MYFILNYDFIIFAFDFYNKKLIPIIDKFTLKGKFFKSQTKSNKESGRIESGESSFGIDTYKK